MRRLLTLGLVLCLSFGAAEAWGYWSAGSVAGGAGASAAVTVNQGATPTAVLAGQAVTVSWAASTLSNGQPVSGYTVARYDATTLAAQTIGTACAGTVTATTCTEANVPAGSWKYAVTPVIGANWRGAESARSATVTTDSVAPTNSISLSTTGGAASLSGTTVYYRGSVAGSLRVTNAVSDAGSGPASSTTGPLTGTTTGWSHTPSTVSTPAGGPYDSAPFSWASSTTSSPGVAVTGRDVAGNTAVTNLSFANDSTAPTAGTVSYANGSTTGGTVSVSFTTGTDAGSGLGTRLLQRASAPLTGITCGTYGAFTTVTNGTNPTSPVVDSVTNGSCYKYQYVVSDQVGNQHVATSANVAHTPYAAHWTFDQGTGTSAPDSSGNGNTATLQAGASWATGKVGPYALNLSGATNSYATAPGPVVDTSQSYSVSAWVKPSSLSGIRTFVSMDGNAISPFYLQMNNGQFQLTTRSSDATASVATTVLGSTAVVGTWYHVAGVYDDVAHTITLYVNGVSQGSAAFTLPWKANGATTVGRAKWNGGNVDFYSGAIDDVRLEGRALSPGEIAALATDPKYSDAVTGTSGLAGYWRLGEATTSSDTFAGLPGATLQSRAGEIGATWSKTGSSDDAVLTISGRLRKSGIASHSSIYTTSAAPPSANYTVEADVYFASALTGDMAGVVGRFNTSNGIDTFYIARYQTNEQKWMLYAVVNGAWNWLGASGVQALTPGTSYRLSLAMSGTSIRMLVNGVEQVSAVDSSIPGAGRGGVGLGLGPSATTVTDITGLHLDNFQITPSVADAAGTNPGIATGGLTFGAAGAPYGEANTAATFDGINDAVVVPDAAALKPATVTVEAWVKPNAAIPNYASVATKTTATTWSDGYGMFASNGGIAFWVNDDDVNRVSTAALPAGAWSHVVGTYDGSTIKVYLNGALVQSLAYSAPLTHSSSPLLIGNAVGAGNFHWAGGLDEVAVYSRALTATEVAQHYAAGQ
jgi:hypothetical protein